MPNRIIKESICASEEINSLDSATECFFYRIMVNCDDHGLLDSRLPILKSKCYPLKEVTPVEIIRMLHAMREAGLIELYKVKDRPYLHIMKWDKHQQIRAKKSKYPQPSEADDTNGNQVLADDSSCGSNPIQSNPIQSESNPIQQEHSQTEKTSTSTEIAVKKETKIKIGFDYNKGLWTGITENPAVFDAWMKAYPGVDLRYEFRRMKAWLLSNPANRKSNLSRFANNWLSKAQERARTPNMNVTFAERKQQFLNQEADEFYQPTVNASNETLQAWGLLPPGEGNEPRAD